VRVRDGLVSFDERAAEASAARTAASPAAAAGGTPAKAGS
jgi:hypothetical protein